MSVKKQFLLIFLVLTQQAVFAQTQLLRGKVREKISQENLIAASVYALDTKQNVATDASGTYQLRLKNGLNKVVATYVGYSSDTLTIDIRQDTTFDFALDPIGLTEVTISASQINLSERIGSIALPMKQLKNIPALLGEADILRALTMLPGVSNGAEGSVGLSVRGGSPDQNLILLDGAAIYNSSHIFGFLSAFNADAIKRVELIKGGFPARYGGRLSSVIDITFKDGNKEKRSAELSVGLIASKFFIESPIKKGRSSYMIALRSSYLDLISAKSKRDFYKGVGKDYRNYNFYDANLKANYLIGKSGSLNANLFYSRDFFINATKYKNTSQYETTIKWSNTVANLRYMQPLTKDILFNTQLTFSSYFYNFSLKNKVKEDAKEDKNFTISSSSNIADIGYKNNFNWSVSKNWTIMFGTELYRQYFRPNVFETDLYGEITSRENPLRKSFSAAVFTDVQTKWTPRISTNIGCRAANYNVDKMNFTFLEPRLSLDYNINDQNSIKLSYNVMNQPLHILSNTTIGFTNDAWVPATKLTPPENAVQYALGYAKNFPKQHFYVSIETFYKNMKNLIDYAEGSNPVLDNSTKGYEQVVKKNGNGRAYGVEFLIHKEIGRWNGIVEYTLSRTERQFSSINAGKWYASRFDRTHDFGLTLNYELTTKWSVSGTFVYTTGTPYSGISHTYAAPNFRYEEDKKTYLFSFQSDKNTLRLPDYHRMDLGVNYKKQNRRKRTVQWSFGAYNVYNQKNVIGVFNSLGSSFNANYTEIVSYKGYRQDVTLFPFIPYLTYSIKLK